MGLLSILIFVLSSNLDNLVLGLSYGLQGIRIGPTSNLLIGLITLVGTVLSMRLGKLLLAVLPGGSADVVGSLAVLLVGLWILGGSLRRRRDGGEDWPREDAERFDRDASKVIEPREALALGLALTLNNIGLGVGASVMGLSVLATSVGSGLCSMLCLYAGNRAGRGWLSRALGRCAEPVSALMIILMGLWGLFH